MEFIWEIKEIPRAEQESESEKGRQPVKPALPRSYPAATGTPSTGDHWSTVTLIPRGKKMGYLYYKSRKSRVGSSRMRQAGAGSGSDLNWDGKAKRKSRAANGNSLQMAADRGCWGYKTWIKRFVSSYAKYRQARVSAQESSLWRGQQKPWLCSQVGRSIEGRQKAGYSNWGLRWGIFVKTEHSASETYWENISINDCDVCLRT